MFSTSDVVAVTKGAISQMIGKGYMDQADSAAELTALDDQYIVDLGEKLQLTEDGDFALNSPADVMYKALLSQCERVVVEKRAYVASLPSLFVDPVNWGLFTEQVLIELSDVMIDEIWNPDGYINYNEPAVGGIYPGVEEGKRIASIEFGCYKPPVSAKVYKKAHGIMVPMTRTYDALFTAFRNAEEFTSFVAGLYNSVENTLQAKAEVYAYMTVSMGIAKATANGNVIDLRTEYAAIGGTTTGVTSEELLQTPAFQAFMLQRIDETQDYMRRMGALYNDHDHVTFAGEVHKILLTKAAKAAKYGVRANTYNEKLLGIGDYDTAPAWQAAIASGLSDPYNFTTASSIYLTKAAAEEAGLTVEDGETTYMLSNVIAVMYDRMAMGITLDRKKVTSQYAASRDSINSFSHALVRYQVNDSYPLVVFMIPEESE